MRKHEKLSLRELYQTPEGPGDPTKLNRETVIVYSGIAVVTAIAFVVIINHGLKKREEKWIAHTKEMNARYIATLEKQRTDAIKPAENTEPVVAATYSVIKPIRGKLKIKPNGNTN